MDVSRFLTRVEYWEEVSKRVASAKRNFAAIAYFGASGADLLPLKAGDTLVVDLSRRAVQQGVTDPREIKRLIERGILVFTRASLHAKVVVAGNVVISSSANVSKNAHDYLDEAGILTDAPSAVRAAKQFIGTLCSEPVLDRYLEECIKLYRPPVFKAARTVRDSPKARRQAKVWYVSGLHYVDAGRDYSRIEPLEKHAAKQLLNPNKSEFSWIRYTRRPKWFSDLHPDCWVIDCTRAHRRKYDVGSPARVIRKSKYVNKNGNTIHLLMLERPCNREDLSLTEFRRRWARIAPKGVDAPKRSQAIVDDHLAGKVLRFWTARGKVASARSYL